MQHTVGRVNAAFARFESCGNGLANSPWVTELLRKKLSGTPIRAYFVAKTAAWLSDNVAFRSPLNILRSGQDRLFTEQLPFVFEAVITIQYLHNQVLDGKSGVTNRARISENILAANLLKEQLYRYIDTELPRYARARTTAAVRTCFECVDQGQYMEQQFNTYAAFAAGQNDARGRVPATYRSGADLAGVEAFIQKIKRDLPEMLHEQLDTYFHRIYLTCAALFVEATQLIGDLMGVPPTQLQPILQFSRSYGLMRQLVNDNADWVPASFGLTTATKTATDHFSDLRNGTLTLPALFFLATHKHTAIEQVLAGHTTWSDDFETEVFDEMITSDALYKSIHNTRILAELALAYLPTNNPAAVYLADSCEIVHWNKFLAPCLSHPAYKLYRRGTYYQQTQRLILQLRHQRQRIGTPQLAKQTWTLRRPGYALPPAVQEIQRLLEGV